MESKMLMAITAIAVAMLLGMGIGSDKVGSDEVAAEVPVVRYALLSELEELTSRVDGIDIQLLSLKEDNVEIVETIKEEKVAESVRTTIKEEPPKPIVQVKPENDFIVFILNNYGGADWYRNKRPPAASHLVSHGFEEDDVAGLSQKELSKLHGAIHTNSMEKLRRAYSGQERMSYQRNNPRVTCGNAQWSNSTQCGSSRRGDRKGMTRWKVCRNGRCYYEWRNN